MQRTVEQMVFGFFVLFGVLLASAGDALAQDAPANPGTGPATDQASEDDPLPTTFPHLETDRVWLSGQANFIFQTHPPFHAPYSGQNSLGPNYEKATSRVLTLYTGVQLNDSTELLIDIEEAGGAALSTGLGMAGPPNLDIVPNPLLSK